MTEFSTTAWVSFTILVLVLLGLDLGVLNRKPHAIKFREAMLWVVFWVSLALIFNVWLYFKYGSQVAQEFLAGYLIEESLSVDNMFVFLLIFTYFRVPSQYQHRVLFWGILSALILRGIMIGAGAYLIHRFHWIIYVFGVFLIYTGIKLARHTPDTSEVAHNPVLNLAKKFLPITHEMHGQKFWIRDENGKFMFTPLILVLLVVETTDVVFAVDSIPAVFGVTKEPFIVYTSNVFAILGLRALYFLLAGVLDLFRFLHYGLAVILCFVGVKMLLPLIGYKMPIPVALGVIAAVLLLSIVVSVIANRRELKRAAETDKLTPPPTQ